MALAKDRLSDIRLTIALSVTTIPIYLDASYNSPLYASG
jgi:hypothetical protein